MFQRHAHASPAWPANNLGPCATWQGSVDVSQLRHPMPQLSPAAPAALTVAAPDQPGTLVLLSVNAGDSGPDVMGSRRGAYSGAEMTVADYLVQLPIGQFEKPLGFAVAVVFEAGCTKDRVPKRDRNRGIVAAHDRPRANCLVLGLVQRREFVARDWPREVRPSVRDVRCETWSSGSPDLPQPRPAIVPEFGVS